MGFTKCIVIYPHYSIIQNSFAAIKIPCVPLIYPSLSPPKPLITILSFHWFYILSFHWFYIFAFSRMSHSWNLTVYSLLDWLLSLSNMHLRFLCVFLWLDRSFLLLLNNITLYGCITVCLSIHLLKNILVASSFQQLWIKLL